jgi:hypothetical protein
MGHSSLPLSRTPSMPFLFFSNAGLSQAHFWQGYAVDPSKGTFNDNPTTQTFQDRVIRFMNGEPPKGKADSDGPPIDWSMFNEEGDNTWLIIHTPGKPGWTRDHPQDASFAQYQAKVAAIGTLVEGKIPGVRSNVHLYQPYDYTSTIDLATDEFVYSGPDAARVDTAARGHAVFQ